MGNEHATSKVAACRQLFIAAGLIYLLLPNLLFLLGWVEAYAALPISALLIAATYWVYRKVKAANGENTHDKPFTIGDGVLLSLLAVGLLIATDLIGFHAQIQQDPDFTYRNAIYAELVCQDWPIYSPRGEYFIYYHSFWLPPALLTKLCGGWLNPQTALFWWCYTGLVLSAGLLYLHLRKRMLLFCALLFGTFSLSYTASVFYYLYDPANEIHALTGLNHFYLTNFLFNQLRCTFNHAIPGALFLSIVLSKGVPAPYILLPAAFLFVLSPMAAVAVAPLLALILFREWKECKHLPVNGPTIICSVFLLTVLPYLGGQGNGSSASLLFLWNDNPFWIQKSVQYTHTWFRVAHGLGLCVSFLLPLFLLLDKNLRRSLLFKALVITTVGISFVWIGRQNNELLFKGSLILAFLQAWLLVQQWEKAAPLRRFFLILFFAVTATALNCGYIRATLHTYRRAPIKRQDNLANEWNWSLNHPEHKNYLNFFGSNRVPWLLYSQPGQSKEILPVPACEKSLFTGN